MPPTITIIEYWYNGYEKSWVIQIKDVFGFQVGSSDYVGSKADALQTVAGYVMKYPRARVIKTGRAG